MVFENKEPHQIFLLLGIIVGALLIFITPPLCTPDENAHFLNAYSISQGNVFPDMNDGKVGKYISKNVEGYIRKYNNRFTSKLDEKYSFKEQYFNSWLTNQDSSEIFFESTLTRINPIGYIFSAFGMAVYSVIIRLFMNASYLTPYNILVFGRIFNLIFYIICIYHAIKTTPFFKRTMMMISLMPMSIFLGASISYDAVLIPVSMLLFSVSLKIICADKEYRISSKDIIMVFTSSFLLGGIKLAYLPLMLVLLAIPIYKFGDRKRYIKLIAITAGIGLLAFLIPNILLKISLKGYDIPTSMNAILQKQYLLDSPMRFIKIFFNSFKVYRTYYTVSFFGNLGQLDTNFPLVLVIIFILCLLFVSIIEGSRTLNINRYIKWLSATAVIISTIGMFYFLYINWTSLDNILGVGATTVSGVQGRYFIPLYLFALIPFSQSVLCKIKFGEKLSGYAVKTSNIIVLLYSFFTVFIVYNRYW